MVYVDLSGVLSRLDTIILYNNIECAAVLFTCVCMIFNCFRIRSKGGVL